MSELIGTRLGQYQIKEHIADGGMASVYRAHQATMGRDVAVKILLPSIVQDKTALDRFYIEVEVIAQLQHPHILPVHDFGEVDKSPYIVMAYLNGGSLADKMGDIMPPDEMVRTVKQIADALDFAHSKGIIHRDFKPGNVLLDEQGNAYLADFGLAKIAESENDITRASIVGTPAYMAPEQAQSESPTKAVDIYALGITIFQMLTGHVPYDGSSVMATMVAHIREPIPDIRESRPDLSGDMQDVIDKALAKEAPDRYSSAGELVKALLDVLQGTPSIATATQEATQPALLMTNMLGHVIFVDNQCLNLLKRHHNEARNIMGKTLEEVLGLDANIAKQLIDTIRTQEFVSDLHLEIKDIKGKTKGVTCSAIATHDDSGAFVGADITLQALPKDIDEPPSTQFETAHPAINTQERNYLQDYFINQLESLYQLTRNWAGGKVAGYLEDIINETGQRNVWPIRMAKGKVTVELKETDIDMYKALLARSMVYAANILGNNQVIKEMEYINKKTDPNVMNFVQIIGLDKMYDDLLN